MDDTINFAREHGYVQTLMGRKRWLKDINSANFTVRGFAERNAINSPIQGSAADILKKSEEFQKLGRENQKELLGYSLGLERKVLLFGIDPKFVPHLANGEQQFVTGFAKFVTPRNADLLTKELTDAHYHIERNANAKMVFVDSSLRLGGFLRI